MGPPPNYVITRKLVRHFFQRYLPSEPITRGNEVQDLAEAIAKYGINHQNTKMAVSKLDAAEAEAKQYRKRIAQMKVPQKVMSTLKRPFYPFNQKGRYRNDLFVDEWTMFHGIR